jgi:hypothetical protein
MGLNKKDDDVEAGMLGGEFSGYMQQHFFILKIIGIKIFNY